MDQRIATQNQRTPVSQIPGYGKLDALYLWSTYRFADGDTPKQYRIFTTLQNDSGQGYASPLVLTARETSIVSNPGQVPLDQKWTCMDIGVEYLPGASGTGVTIAQANDLNNKLQLAFVRGATQVFEVGPCSLYPAGGGVTGVVDAADANTASVANNGFPSAGARRQLKGRNVVLNPGDTFLWALIVANADDAPLVLGEGATVDVRVSFWMFRDLGMSG